MSHIVRFVQLLSARFAWRLVVGGLTGVMAWIAISD